jgi:hypothetical protein
MKYSININQKALVELNSETGANLDLKDATIISFFKDYTHFPKVKKQIIDNEIFYWVSYQWIIDENPLLEIENKDVLGRRIEKICNTGILQKFLDKKDGNKVYLAFGENYQRLITDTPPTYSKQGSLPTQKSEPLPTQKSDNYNTNILEYKNNNLSPKPAVEISKIEILKDEIQANPLYPKIISLYPKIPSERLETEIEFALTKFIELGRTSGAFSYIKSYLSNADFKDVLTNKKLEIEDEINSRRKTAYEQKTSQNSSQNTTTNQFNQIEVDPDDFQTQNDFAKFTQKLDAEGKNYKVLRINFTRQRIWDEANEKPTEASQPQKSEAKTPMEILMESMRKANPKLAEQMERGGQNPFIKIAQKLAQN